LADCPPARQDTIEPFNGRTVEWLTSLAQGLKVYLGTTFLEAEGEDFFNTFALATPDGAIAGRVRKSPPASLEAYFYRAGSGTHVIDTGLGRVGVGICYENLLFAHLRDLYHASVDLVLQLAVAGRPKPFIPGDLERFDHMVQGSHRTMPRCWACQWSWPTERERSTQRCRVAQATWRVASRACRRSSTPMVR